MLDEIKSGHDETVRALKSHADALSARIVLVGGLAVIKHGYERTTIDRDFLVGFGDAHPLADRLMDDSNWERLEIRQYAFLYRPTEVCVDFLVSRDLIQLGRHYRFPDLEQVETLEGIEGIPVIGLYDLLFLKLLAGRMKDLADIMELVKRHPGAIDAGKITSRLEREDADLIEQFEEILRQAPIELANERRLGRPDPNS
jgi:hypothetical protein